MKHAEKAIKTLSKQKRKGNQSSSLKPCPLSKEPEDYDPFEFDSDDDRESAGGQSNNSVVDDEDDCPMAPSASTVERIASTNQRPGK